MSKVLKTFNHLLGFSFWVINFKFVFFYLPAYRIVISVLLGLIYFIWGLVTHWQDDSLHWPVVLEYLCFSLLAVIILIFKPMKGIILAGGKGTRLEPLTLATNKHLLPIYDQPMIFYPIKTLVSAGITDILVVTGDIHAGQFMSVLTNGKQLGIHHLEYAYQEGGL